MSRNIFFILSYLELFVLNDRGIVNERDIFSNGISGILNFLLNYFKNLRNN